MEIKIGITDMPHEIVVDVEQTPEEIEAQLHAALAEEHGVFALAGSKGRRVLIPSRSIGYVDLGEANPHKVGFGTL
ncbi:MAG: DUF3107 domain-containing protein [Cutibacterium granulosum]|uniref:ATP-binding protein n=2 Tax=Cutibacterium granulosum TaxID=33011 RepID=U1FF71_9ACTN|nr:DUF3107 domain-containing protein [Cutibacterium granulosum]MBX7473283.1 DUF3107 domain-containing protein [Streptomyces sp. MAG02]MDU3271938.1 DUF3107 domain-containing protein [Cutibacterium sp.]ERF57881.1 ATP-binding protein [Cutibacterium granulosum DSM 20700]ERF66119.1 ATP-binding protein [Cutibacterium granulosum TM11]MBS5254972.1 DUF3107 domain-containing protein [Cutibacterium granulosum]